MNLRKFGVAHTFHFLVEHPYANFQRLVMMGGDTDGHLIVQSQAGTILTGREIDLEHIVGWAIKHRYLGTLDREDEDD